ncbi:MAG: type VI secretion system contractile sheath large subunit, partial [Thermoanaerobaculia bacterium]
MADPQKAQEAQPAGKAAEAQETSLIDDILRETKLAPKEEGYDTVRRGLEAFIAELLAPERGYEKADKRAVDLMIAEIDKKLSRQVDEVLH